MARAFDIVPITTNTVQYIKSIFLTASGDNQSEVGIYLDGGSTGGITITNLANHVILGTDSSGKLQTTSSSDVYNFISGYVVGQSASGDIIVNGTFIITGNASLEMGVKSYSGVMGGPVSFRSPYILGMLNASGSNFPGTIIDGAVSVWQSTGRLNPSYKLIKSSGASSYTLDYNVTSDIFNILFASGDLSNTKTLFSILPDGRARAGTSTLALIGNDRDYITKEYYDNNPSSFITSGTVTSNMTGHYFIDDFVFGSPKLTAVGDSDYQSRFFFDKSLSAFRAGLAKDTWDTAELGLYSVAFGYETTAKGIYSFAGGNFTHATGYAAFAFGEYTFATATGSVAFGYRVNTNSLYGFNIGQFNIGLTNSIFEIGMGNGDSNRANALTILDNGYVGIGMTGPQQVLDVSGAIQSNSAFYLTGGTIPRKITVSGDNLSFQAYTGGNWEERNQITP